MTDRDRRRWDERYARLAPEALGGAELGVVELGVVEPPDFLAPHVDLFPSAGHALDVACGQGRAAVWLASRGLHVRGLDISRVAIGHARDLARRRGVGDRCRFDVVDLDGGLPAGPPVDVIVCNKFRDPRLDQALIRRLSPGGLIALSVLSEVGAGPGPFRAVAGELPAAFAQLEVLAADEADGAAWLLARA